MPDLGAVRPIGTIPRPSRPPQRGRWVVVVGVAAGLFFTLVAGNPSIESDRSANTVPPLPPEPTTPPSTLPIPPEPVPSPLDDLVPGFQGTLVMTVAGGEGTEVWRWSSGPDGVIDRSFPVADVYDAGPDLSGAWIAAVHRIGRELPSLQMGIETNPTPVFWGARSFAWHAATPGKIAWAEQRDTAMPATIHIGERLEDGVFFKPAATLDGFDFVTGADRLVAYDGSGFVVERWSTNRAPSVQRLGLTGEMSGLAPGQFVGISRTGNVAVRDGLVTRILTGGELDEGAIVPAPYSSLVWAPDTTRYAAANIERDSVDLTDGAARRTVGVGAIAPAVIAWSPNGRFALVSGRIASDPVIVFIDAATLDTWTVLLEGNPVAAVVIP